VTRNIAASVHQRLLNYAHATGRPFNEVLQYYALNRFLYRLGQSDYRDRFILKGALMLVAWDSPVTRPTRDIDLLGHVRNLPETVAEAMRSICALAMEEDGLRFNTRGLSAQRIIEGASYVGVRVRFTGYLGNARIPMQIDVGFGDALVPAPMEVQIPYILDLPPTVLLGYARESVIAEKLQIMVALGEINSRLKDFYDLWLLASGYAFSGPLLAQAIRATFTHRSTPIALPIIALDESFANPARETQWRAFLRRNRLDEPQTLRETIRVIAPFALPILATITNGGPFEARWEPGGPWREA
jgi:predicted nucleotidyltransferase component of viral defense system